MSNPDIQLLDLMSPSAELRRRAIKILHVAKTRTGPGSGHELKGGTAGLPAICAFIASEELGDNEIPCQVAQKSSCLKASVFNNKLAVVRAVLDPPSESTTNANQRSPLRSLYDKLCDTHNIQHASTVVKWMAKIEGVLVESGQWRLHTKKDEQLMKNGVFYWICRLIGDAQVTVELLSDNCGFPLADFNDLVKVIEDVCVETMDQIRAEIEDLDKSYKSKGKNKFISTPVSTPTKTKRLHHNLLPSHPRATASPSKSAMRTSASPQKRKVSFLPGEEGEENSERLEGPSKRRKLSPVFDFSAQNFGMSSSSANLGLDRLRLGGRDTEQALEVDADVAMQDIAQEEETLPISAAGPSGVTPTQTSRSTRYRRPTPPPDQGLRDAQLSSDSEDSEDDLPSPVRTRLRPAFADRQQWLKRDPKVEREWARAAAVKEKLGGRDGLFERFGLRVRDGRERQ